MNSLRKTLQVIVIFLFLFLLHHKEVKPAFACIPSGDQTAIQNALQGEGARAVLCPNAIFHLNAPITFTAANQEIVTEGMPTDGSRARLKVTNSQMDGAIIGTNVSGIKLKNIIVNGNRTELGRYGSQATISIGGQASGQMVDHVKVFEPRSWSALLIHHGSDGVTEFLCDQATITNNEIGPAGWPGDGEWADGISLACKNSIVTGNTVVDATDGAIVVFGSPGSRVENNMVIARSRVLLGGILAVDRSSTQGLVIANNTVKAEGAMIKVGVGAGKKIWYCLENPNLPQPATLQNNTLTGQYFGYGYVLSDLNQWTVTGNTSSARHSGIMPPVCGATVTQPTVSPFLMQNVTGNIQPEFQNATLYSLYNLTPDPAVYYNWLPPFCSGSVFKGCALLGPSTPENPNPICQHWGAAGYGNWSAELWGQCSAACSEPNTVESYCAARAEKSSIDLTMDGVTTLADYVLFKNLYSVRSSVLDYKVSSAINSLDYNVFKKIYRR